MGQLNSMNLRNRQVPSSHQEAEISEVNKTNSKPASKKGPKKPTDDEIIAQENRIREAEVNIQPLVSPPLPLSILRDEYVNTAFMGKVEEIDARYSVMRKTRGDGNCFFRAFAFAFIENFVKTYRTNVEEVKLKALNETVFELLKSAGFDKMAYEDFYEELGQSLRDASKVDDDAGTWLEGEWNDNPHRSHSLVVLLRLVASAYLRAHAEEYEPFLWEINEPVEGMVQYCQKYVECLGVESDQIHIIALSRALSVSVDIAYLDASEGPLSTISFEPDNSADSPSIRVSLLYRPGHYDILYPK